MCAQTQTKNTSVTTTTRLSEAQQKVQSEKAGKTTEVQKKVEGERAGKTTEVQKKVEGEGAGKKAQEEEKEKPVQKSTKD